MSQFYLQRAFKHQVEKVKWDLLFVSMAGEGTVVFSSALCIRNFIYISFPFSERFYQWKLQVHVTGENRFLTEQVGTVQQFIPAASGEKK